ncbi:MAG: tetratricopeptide repeat protein [Microcystaceae cyanobacterium]
MNDHQKQQFYAYYETGQAALESGQYRVSVENLEKAIEVASINTKLGAEACIALITAYQAVGDTKSAIALCRQLATHPYPSFSEKGKYLLYILEAPRLQRPAEWMTQIPNLANETGKPKYVSQKPPKSSSPPSGYKIDSVDLSQVNTKDNGFIWIALAIILLMLGGTLWFS